MVGGNCNAVIGCEEIETETAFPIALTAIATATVYRIALTADLIIPAGIE